MFSAMFSYNFKCGISQKPNKTNKKKKRISQKILSAFICFHCLLLDISPPCNCNHIPFTCLNNFRGWSPISDCRKATRHMASFTSFCCSLSRREMALRRPILTEHYHLNRGRSSRGRKSLSAGFGSLRETLDLNVTRITLLTAHWLELFTWPTYSQGPKRERPLPLLGTSLF